MAKRGRKPKLSIAEEPSLKDEEEESIEIIEPKKRGRRSKKQLTIAESILGTLSNPNIDVNSKEFINYISTINLDKPFDTVEVDDEDDDVITDEDDDEDDEKSEENDQYIFELRTMQTGLIKSLIEALKEIIVEANLECSPQGIKVLTKNANETRIILLILNGNKFQYYNCKKEKLHMGVRICDLYKLVKGLNNNSTFAMYMDNDDEDNVGIVIDNNENKTNTTFTLKLYSLDVLASNSSASCQFSAIISIGSSFFQKTCRDMATLGTKIRLTANNGKLTISCNKGNNVDEPYTQETVIAESDRYMKFWVKNKEIIQAEYYLKDIIAFTKCSNIAGDGYAKIYMDSKLPLVIEYNVGNMGSIKMLLNPIQTKSTN